MERTHRARIADVVHIYLAGLNTGIYAARDEDDESLDSNPCNGFWLAAPAEKATEFGSDEEGDAYMLSALVKAIFKNAGISME